MTKTRWIPEGYKKFSPEIAGYEKLGEAYVDFNKNTAIFYTGKQSNHTWFNRFSNGEDMKKKILSTYSGLMSWEDCKAERKAERKQGHTLKVGDILYSSWGYDQTNVNFYQVLEVVGALTVKIREIAGKLDHSSGFGQDYVVPVKDSFLSPRNEWDNTGKVLTRRASASNRINVSDSQTAWIWEGKPVYETSSGWGH